MITHTKVYYFNMSNFGSKVILWILFGFSLIAVALILFFQHSDLLKLGYYNSDLKNEHEVNKIKMSNPNSTTKDTITIIGVGDIMLGTNYPSTKYLPPNDGKELLLPVKEILIDADITFGNLEGGYLTGDGYVKKCNNPDVCYTFKSPEHYVNYIKEAGFDVLSIANNHIDDFGSIGRNNTVRVLSENNIYFAGLNEYPYSIFEQDGIRYGFCAFSPCQNTVNMNDYENVYKIVTHLDSLCDIVIVSFHGGAEGKKYRNLTKKTEYFLEENRGNPYQFARNVIDAGADIVFGHGPHVTRAVDLYKDRFIAFSLGNFATYGRFNLNGSSGLAPIVKVKVNRNGEFLNAQIISIKQIGDGGPLIDSTNSALKEIILLTTQDFPDSPLIIQNDGSIIKKNQSNNDY